MPDERQKLLAFLNDRFFVPVLRTSFENYPECEQHALVHVQTTARAEQERYKTYKDAEEVREHYMRDVHSRNCDTVNSALKRLKLPRLMDIKDEFLTLCKELEVGPHRQ
jgi:hypothetical protein